MKPGPRNLLLSPGPTNVHDDVRQALLGPDACHREAGFTEVLRQLNEDLVAVLGGRGTHACVPFAASGTGANEAIMASLTGRVLVLVAGPYSERLVTMATRLGIDVVTLRFDPLSGIAVDGVEDALRRDDEVANVFAVHCETTTGVMAPLTQLGTVCRRSGVVLAVDGISSVGAHPIDLERDGITFCSVSANKCLESIPGLSFVLARVDRLHDTSRSYYLDLFGQWRSLEESGQSRFTMPTQLVQAAAVAVRRLVAEGYGQRVARYSRLRARLVDGLVERGIRLVAIPPDRVSNLYVLVEQPGGLSYAELHDGLLQHGITIYTDVPTQRRGHLALATMGAIGNDEIDRFLEALSSVLDARSTPRLAASGRT